MQINKNKRSGSRRKICQDRIKESLWDQSNEQVLTHPYCQTEICQFDHVYQQATEPTVHIPVNPNPNLTHVSDRKSLPLHLPDKDFLEALSQFPVACSRANG